MNKYSSFEINQLIKSNSSAVLEGRFNSKRGPGHSLQWQWCVYMYSVLGH